MSLRHRMSAHTLIEAKYSPRASYTPNQKIVLPKLIQSGDAGLVAEVGAVGYSVTRNKDQSSLSG